MSNRFFSYHNTACGLVAAYRKEMPLQHFLKQYFSRNKKHGSKDRRWISHFCYAFYRLGKSLPGMETEQRLKVAAYLCTEDIEQFGSYLPDDWLKSEVLDEKIQCIQNQFGFRLEDIFPFPELLMPEIDPPTFSKSFLRQPDVFLRIRPGRESVVVHGLEKANMPFDRIGKDAIRIKDRVAVAQMLQTNKDVVVQDLDSQLVATLFPGTEVRSIWDCCAGSGGKTILARDRYPKAKIVASDIRASILQNHKKRMQEAGVNVQKYWVQDLLQPVEGLKEQFDMVVCDTPCSGSGTWARTPEEMFFFEKGTLASTVALQSAIVDRVVGHLKEGGYLLYITCSLFGKENDDVVNQAMEAWPLSIEKKAVLNGLGCNADTLYACLLKKG